MFFIAWQEKLSNYQNIGIINTDILFYFYLVEWWTILGNRIN